MSFKVLTSSPSKCILSGEHSIVYHHPAITMAIDKRNQILGTYFRTGKKPTVSLELKSAEGSQKMELPVSLMTPFFQFILTNDASLEELKHDAVDTFGQDMLLFAMAFTLSIRFFKKFASHFNIKKFCEVIFEYDGVLDVASEVPVDAGLGSSASFFSALILNLYAATRKILIEEVGCTAALPNPEILADVLAHLEPVFIEMESIVHGKTTGVDVKTVIRGGLLYISSAGIEDLFPQSQFDILLVDTGLRAKTADAVKKVQEKVLKGGGEFLIEQISETTKAIKALLSSHDCSTHSVLFSKVAHNHNLLSQLGLSNEKIDEVVGFVTSYGVPCKITGKGMGGFVLAICDQGFPEKQKVVQGLENLGYPVLCAQVNKTGILCEYPE